MIGNVIKLKSGDVEYPLVLTEAEFLEILNKGIYTKNLIGHQVTLTNTAATSGTNPNYMIVDVNHDSGNTGQTNCYDLMSVDCVCNPHFGGSNVWRNCTARTYLNSTFYNGFSENFKSHIMNIKYNSQGTWYADDRIIMPSVSELCGDYSNFDSKCYREGIMYPVCTLSKTFTSNDSSTYWWTRSTSKLNGNNIWIVDNDPILSFTQYAYNNGFGDNAVLFRVQ